MGLLDQIRIDVAQITGNTAEWGIDITFTAPDASTCSVVGTATKHHLGFDRQSGAPMNTKTASVSVSELAFIAANYTVRNDNGEVNLKGHKVDCKDSTGEVKN